MTDKSESREVTQRAIKSKVSAKSTKQELWEAYSVLVDKITVQPLASNPSIDGKTVPEVLRRLAELKLATGEELDKLANTLLNDLNSLRDTRTALTQEKQAMLSQLASERLMLEEEMKKIKEKWDEEKRNHTLQIAEATREQARERKIEDDDYKYDLALKRRQENDAYEKMKQEREVEIAAREQVIKDRDNEVKAMEAELAAWPEKMAAAIKEARDQLTKDLAQSHETQLRELQLIRESDSKLNALKIANLEATIKSQESAIDNLQKQYVDTSRQLKEMAVSAIAGRSAGSNPAIGENNK